MTRKRQRANNLQNKTGRQKRVKSGADDGGGGGLPSPGTCGKDGAVVAETNPSGSRDGLVGRKQDGQPLLREPELRIKQDQRADGEDTRNREGAEAHEPHLAWGMATSPQFQGLGC